jgi:hypothetical protein
VGFVVDKVAVDLLELHETEEEGTRILQNVGNYLPVDRA